MLRVLKRFYQSQQGFSLIVVVFLMMILAILGWTMANFLAGDFESGVRSFDSEQALYLAEAGKEWALRQLMTNATWNTSTDRDCNHTNEWRTHNLSGGQYQVCCRGNRTDEAANFVIESVGFVPRVLEYIARRKVKLLLTLGNMGAAIQANNLFDWSDATTQGNRFQINGDIIAGHYEGTDSNVIQDQPADLEVPDNRYNRTFIVPGTFPHIDMNYFLSRAGTIWALGRESNITRINGNEITVQNPIFTTGSGEDWVDDVAVRNMAAPGWAQWVDASWREITQRINSTAVRLGGTAPGWLNGSRIRTVKRYYQSPPDGPMFSGRIEYIQGDALIDVRTNAFTPERVSVIAEGDIGIRGTQPVQMTNRGGLLRLVIVWFEPNLATQNGTIWSPDTPTGNNDQQKRENRQFESIVFSETGDVRFHYYYNNYNGTYGNNVNLSGSVYVRKQGRRRGWWSRIFRRRIPSGGFDFSPVIIEWKEQ